MELKEINKFGMSKDKNFKVKNSIGVPHPYCITPRHLNYGNGILNKEAIKEAEENKVFCGTCKGDLSFEEHKQALIISCKLNVKKDKKAEKELNKYLNKIKDKAEKKGYVGFAFMLVLFFLLEEAKNTQ